MKALLFEITVSELREFISYNNRKKIVDLNDLSLVSLKLRLQFLITQHRRNKFQSFFEQYKQSETLRQQVLSNLYVTSNELFRDSECWAYFYKDLHQCIKSSTFEMCIFEFGNFADTVSLLTSLTINNLIHKTKITVIDFISERGIPLKFNFTPKEFEAGMINFRNFSSSVDLENYFVKKDEVYSYVVPDNVKIHFVSGENYSFTKGKFDAVIARNLSINYNFKAHQILFQKYLDLMKSPGILFVGLNENFEWCSGMNYLSKSDQTKPLYNKFV